MTSSEQVALRRAGRSIVRIAMRPSLCVVSISVDL
jgi:hypothetical protein